MTSAVPQRATPVEAILGLGSNIGDLRVQIDCAVAALHATPGVRVIRHSAYYRTAPWGETNQPSFLNICIAIETTLDPRTLLETALRIEQEAGRVRRERWGPRIIDIDILFYGDEVIDEPHLHVPHPYIGERAFVLAPLVDIAPERMIGSRSVREAAAAIDMTGIERLDWEVHL
ncbi:2-amino-4-hydroxy-6-hydroxymethyldihydropteridine diphosphokinase [Chelatococcus daeguensis]|uniref:2-amino-4-hydroxy-6-hydroxymethyldihydropteridine pyrophosphokinase n=1 Tax=Chelatococcus daeguensis TaxID=444444 RepID=A0AAC9JNV4_9HYPH|nr:2-amino-4-hydroxy-6-hydroxymethyldihydropteridine diphosphokinase [Chelatococcus daeguensis]APF37383.1 2-amino-4-hydroxy-6-hydroxymethyldihydropteridine diphosphokinase [Chelatococcus daeguensis]